MYTMTEEGKESPMALWENFESHHPTAQERTLVSKVVAIEDFLGDSNTSRTFHVIVENCPNTVYKSRIMRYAIQFKWESSVLSMQLWMMRANFSGVLLATVTMLVMTHDVPFFHEKWHASGLILVMVAVECGVLLNELRQLFLLRLKKYFGQIWNLLDLTSCSCLLTASVVYFFLLVTSAQEDGSLAGGSASELNNERIRTFGGIGVCVKWMGMMDYLRLFPMTAPHIRMIAVIASDISPFIVILTIANLAASFSYSILMPTSDEFNYSDATYGVFGPFVTVLLNSLGSWDEEAYTNPAAAVLFLTMTVFLMVLMLNMVSVCAGWGRNRIGA
eukprot:SAG22_NODE_1083_length_5646_cov_8.060934_3_plen_332_part_00